MKLQLLALAVLAPCASPVWSAECDVAIEGNDAMQYNVKSIVVPKSCSQYTVTLKHVGKMAKNVMGHNFVLGKSADIAGISADGMKAGPAADYLKPGDTRVIAHSKVVGGGESTSISIPVATLKAGEAYTYFCSFPGHSATMNGTLKLGDYVGRMNKPAGLEPRRIATEVSAFRTGGGTPASAWSGPNPR